MDHAGETEFDLGALTAALWRRAWLIALVAATAAAATYVALSFVSPLYRADARILIEARESPLTRPRDTAPDADLIRFDESAIESQVEVLRSRAIADRVIDELNLTRRPDFDPDARPSLTANLLFLVGLREAPPGSTLRQRVLETYYRRLSVYPVGRSRVIAVEFEAHEPQLAADIANTVAEAFVDLQSEAKRESAVAATRWLEQEIARLRERVAEAEAEVAAYRAGSALFDVALAPSDITTQQLSEINAELARAKGARAEAQSRAELVRQILSEGGSLDAAQEVLDSPLIQRLRERQVGLQAQIAELSTTLLPGHPRIRALQSQLADLDGQTRREVEKVLESLETSARVARAREHSLVESLNEAKAAVAQANEESITLRALQREADAQRQLLETFLTRYREAVARTDSGYEPADARIISRAIAPRRPSFPRKGLMSALVALTSLMLATGLVLTREFTSGRAFRLIGAPPLPAGSGTAGDPMIDMSAGDAPPDPTAFGVPTEPPALAEVAQVLAQQGVRVALVAGAYGGEDAGGLALAAARASASGDLRAVLLDIGAEPSPALGGDVRPGLGDLLAGNAAFGEAIRRDEASRVHVIPMGSREEDPPLQRLALVIGALSHTYDRVVIVADRLADWPPDHVRPDVAIVVCGPDMAEDERRGAYQLALERGARGALIVRRMVAQDEAEADAADAAA